MKDVLQTTKSYQAAKFGELLLKYAEAPRSWITEVTWIYGPSGAGKTSLAAEMLPEAWWSGSSAKWFDGYDSHPDVIIDDLRAEDWPFVFLLRLLDSKPVRVECKGGSRQWRPRRVCITTLRKPSETYRAGLEPIEQLERRISKLIEVAPAQKSGVIRDSVADAPSSNPDIDELAELLKEFEPIQA